MSKRLIRLRAFQPQPKSGQGIHSWYNASIKAWLSWGNHRVSDHKRLQISYTRRLMLSSATQTINNHKHKQARKGNQPGLGQEGLTSLPQRRLASGRRRSWHPGIPHIRDTELMPASQSQSDATSATSLSDASVVVSVDGSGSRRRKRRRNGSSSRTKPPRASSSATSSYFPSTLRSAALPPIRPVDLDKSRRPFEFSQV
ncbi:uncharacterized protein FMAN_08563 [Fusarium mangiferae]|uniref:Uncharacterized protein n=1 Tax=Fusarium mangiferae TaxID=192010 RepID=A0A1L7TIT6_FUSMA|nr:uncharacterized protein FMAN_08563 [Fusarium mangiferae]CVK98598.1 uncharacterized protein FMAN_08563 [Fusarium mangiferae]